MSEPRVAALVLNYNGPRVTLETLDSLVAMRSPGTELMVIDNGSTDDSHEQVRRRFPDLRQLRVRENRGISWGLDHGLQVALDEGFDYALVMNNDIEAHPEMLVEMLAVTEADPEVGCVGVKAYYHSDRGRIWSAGGILRFREAITRERGEGELDRGQYDRTEEVPYVNGVAMLIRRNVLERIGLWDPAYFLGVEDADFCVRARRAGFRCVYAHRAVLWHMISASIGVYKPFRTFHTARSTAIFLRKYAAPHQWASSLLWFVAALPVAWLRELPRGNQRAVHAKVRGLLDGLRAPLPPLPTAVRDLVPPSAPEASP
ncbi:MAG: glycosyltransferase family 2 protein [Acidobacteria bacterium]|nr:MAG: glycosyltransferase family 2 protein [Acidobacteriota bacterium]REK07346.1 MAG: glycosyltransferase family 2 protein [Acidobacteriota bacterium]